MKYNVHGNGFVQIELANGKRMHIFSDVVTRQKVPTLIHNHRFCFISHVIRGQLLNVMVQPIADGFGEYLMYTPATDKIPNIDGKLRRLGGGQYKMDIIETMSLGTGGVYAVREGDYHLTVPIGEVVTVMERLNEFPISPVVFCHKSLQPSNEFSRVDAMEEGDVWDLIFRLELEGVIEANGGLLR